MIRSLLKFAALAGGMLLLLAAVEAVKSGVASRRWDDLGAPACVCVILIVELAAGAQVITMMMRLGVQRGRATALMLAMGLVGMSLVGMAELLHAQLDFVEAQIATLPLAFALVVTLAAMRQRKALWAGLIALAASMTGMGLLMWAYSGMG